MRGAEAITGRFVALEGIEGAGKTTQVAMLAERLRVLGREPVVVREPGGTPFAEEVRRLLLHAAHDLSPAQEVFLFQAARGDLVTRVIAPALEAGRVVVADRFALSTRCYQGSGRGLPADLVEAAIRLATGGLEPDLYVVLDLAFEVGRRRQLAEGKGLDRIERAASDFHRRVAEAFRNAAGGAILHMDADRPPATLHGAIWAELAARFPDTFPAVAG